MEEVWEGSILTGIESPEIVGLAWNQDRKHGGIMNRCPNLLVGEGIVCTKHFFWLLKAILWSCWEVRVSAWIVGASLGHNVASS